MRCSVWCGNALICISIKLKWGWLHFSRNIFLGGHVSQRQNKMCLSMKSYYTEKLISDECGKCDVRVEACTLVLFSFSGNFKAMHCSASTDALKSNQTHSSENEEKQKENAKIYYNSTGYYFVCKRTHCGRCVNNLRSHLLCSFYKFNETNATFYCLYIPS